MERRNFIKIAPLAGLAGAMAPGRTLASAVNSETVNNTAAPLTDRQYHVKLLQRITTPVVENMSKGTLKKNMPLEKGPGYGLAVEKVTYLEAFGRCISGMAPWLALPDDNTPEGKIRKQLREQVLQGIVNGVNPSAPDYLNFRSEAQPLVDAAYLCQTFMRAPEALWQPLDNTTKSNVIKELKELRRIRPAYNNWLLFAGMVEAFLLSIGEEYEPLRTMVATKKIQEWYAGDGFYSDGPQFSLDYYNGYVIHPMFTDMLKVLVDKKQAGKADYDQAIKRMQRFAELQERMIAPDGTYPALGRSMTYRTAAFQPLVQLALNHQLPDGIEPAQVRCAMTAIMKNIFEMNGTFDQQGWLQLGICGHQPEVADVYTSTGSLYICTNGFLALGLPEQDPFWSAPAAEWTAKKVWSGKPVKKDYHVNY
ncbi:MAG TPA: DUF2264 domain-containing protein [Chitinophaga sp.]|uniref:DUF2264 domain-containing protein n=1 Tax=Chitinophaga sp. TaxID=1869181 RepID=UPI002BB423C0|nr:DUF2264 domain-containing protein [Chitinophaga sp.]HVI43253.1 DUF2264 domain-containing protein [Chitinophaga sp.]